jgi:hypothetical protein
VGDPHKTPIPPLVVAASQPRVLPGAASNTFGFIWEHRLLQQTKRRLFSTALFASRAGASETLNTQHARIVVHLPGPASQGPTFRFASLPRELREMDAELKCLGGGGGARVGGASVYCAVCPAPLRHAGFTPLTLEP